MDISTFDIFWMAIALIKVVIFIANFAMAKSDQSGNCHRPGNTATNFDIMKETR